ncbi:NIPSNAP family protein [Paralcaligenes sp. KSB-10]|jgi:hypothetical protein|uniref:NIPSNAP family protein n=1 Tax=Paralcaligenes sp. KSB-10 TaxID=2901142 RepID=UPI001E5DCBC4|nr:NIPSNAP family protein [Paralcaligenes sp. KSB-10]UHL62708.1 NIPSNAP family protein [Paralcaligenes sp. KSB-10]
MIYELKKYIAHPGKAAVLQTRFADKTLPIFQRLGIELLHCWNPAEDKDALYYLVGFPDNAARENAWAAFGADAEWLAIKAESEREGPLLKAQSAVTLIPTRFSPNEGR